MRVVSASQKQHVTSQALGRIRRDGYAQVIASVRDCDRHRGFYASRPIPADRSGDGVGRHPKAVQPEKGRKIARTDDQSVLAM